MTTTVDGTNGLTVPGTGSVVLNGATSGTVTIAAPAVAGSTTLTLPATTGTVLAAGNALVYPQGRLTLATATPVMTSAQTGKTTLYYTPYLGSTVPIYDGTNWSHARFSELSNITTNSSTGSAGPAAVTTNSNYDLFVWSSGGTLTLTSANGKTHLVPYLIGRNFSVYHAPEPGLHGTTMWGVLGGVAGSLARVSGARRCSAATTRTTARIAD